MSSMHGKGPHLLSLPQVVLDQRQVKLGGTGVQEVAAFPNGFLAARGVIEPLPWAEQRHLCVRTTFPAYAMQDQLGLGSRRARRLD